MHSTIKPYKCPECTYACADPTNLRNHLITHTKESRFKCDICGHQSKMVQEFRNHYFQKHNILKKGKIEKQPCPKTDEMYKKALAASNLKSGGTIFNMIEGLEQPTHDRIGRVLNNEKRKRTLQESDKKKLAASDSEDEDIPLALLAKQSGGQLPWEEPKPKKKRARKKKVENAKNGHSETALVPIEDPLIEPSEPPTQVAAGKSKVKKKEDRKPTRRSGRASTQT